MINVINANILDEDMHNFMVLLKWMCQSDNLIDEFNQFLVNDGKVEEGDVLSIETTRQDMQVMARNLSYVHEALFGGSLSA